jgi:hypothetical protein
MIVLLAGGVREIARSLFIELISKPVSGRHCARGSPWAVTNYLSTDKSQTHFTFSGECSLKEYYEARDHWKQPPDGKD